MKQRNEILSVAAIGFLLLTGLVLAGIAALGITSIIACYQLGKRLGYDLYAGLLLLIPGVNLFVFCYWAFKESPTERKIRTYLGKKETTNR